MKWSISLFGLASLGSIASALPLLNDPENLLPQVTNGTELVARTDNFCTPAKTAPLNAVGGRNGGSFCGSKWPGPILPKSLTTFSPGDGKSITGIQMTYSDGTTDQWGKGFNNKPSGSITLAPGELITSAWLAGNGVGTRLGKIHLETNKGQTVDLGGSTAPNIYKTDVGSGLWVGITGNSGDAIDNLALLFAKPKITGISVGNMQIDAGQLSSAQGKPAQAAFTDQVHYFNDGNVPQTFMFQNSRTVTNTVTTSQSTTGTIGQTISFSVEFSIPEIVKLSVSNSITWSVAHTTGTDVTNTKTYTAQYQQGGTLAANTGVDCTAIIWEGEGTFSYKSTVTYNFDDGTTFSYPENGQLTTKQFTQGQSTCKPTTSNVAPKNFLVGKTAKKTS